MSQIIISDNEIIANHDQSLIDKYGKANIMNQLALMSGYEEAVPDIETFIDDPYYLGKVLGQGLYPIWREAAKKVFPTPYHSPYDEIVLSGAIGLGKSTFSLLITFYNLCRMLSLKNPHQYYNLIDSTIIAFAMMNATKGLAGSVLYAQFLEWVEASPYFKSKVNNKNNKRSFFIKNIDVSIGSRGRDYLGQATPHAIFSEINDMTVVGGQAQDNFDTIQTRRDSRFGGKGKEILGHLILDSSNKGNRSFIDTRIEEKRKNNVTDFILFAYSHWEAKWHLGGYSGQMFQVYAGDENRDPFIITEDHIVAGSIKTLKPERIIDVPVEHKQQFEVNIIKSLRDLAGVSTYSTFSFISSNEIIGKVFNRANYCNQALIELDFFDQTQMLDKFIDFKLLAFLCSKPRFIHVDLGLKTDSTGIACSYLEGFTDTTRYDTMTGTQLINREPVFVTEWVMEIRAIPGQEVAIYKIKELLLTAKRLGYPIKVVSTDGFQSSNLRQDLLLKGIETKLISVDRTKDPYNLLRNIILENRLSAPNSSKLIKEIRELEEGDDKYDHPEDGTKDISDAVCGSIWSCSQELIKSGNLVTPDEIKKNIDALGSFLSESGSTHSRFENKLLSMFNK